MLTVALLILAQAATPAATPPLTPERADARCLTAFATIASSDRAEVQRAGQLGALYFYGKLLGRNPGIGLSAVMVEASRAVGPNATADLRRCGGEMEAAGKSMIAVGTALSGGAPATTPVLKPAPTPPKR